VPSLRPEVRKALDQALQHYRTAAFIATDPMQFACGVRSQPQQAECLAWLASLMSYGYRPLVIQAIQNLLDRLEGDPLQALQHWDSSKFKKALRGFQYRFYKGPDWVWHLETLQRLYERHATLEESWLKAQPKPNLPLNEALQHWLSYLVSHHPWQPEARSYGQRYLLPQPQGGGACKRHLLFLRWVTRSDDDLPEPLDLGLWRQALTPAELVMPLDTHVGQQSRRLGLLTRATNDWKAAEELTALLRQLDARDPVKYDFAFMGLGTEKGNEF
jgi:uncharacterized protein (TIGR02757 family)